MLTFAVLALFPVVMAFAAFSDLFTMTISNRVSLLLVAGFAIIAPLAGLSLGDIGMHVACGAGVLVLTFSMFAFGWIGGGDAKLAASTALWLGWEQLGDYSLIAALLGGVLTAAILALRKWPLPAWLFRPDFMRRLADNTSGVPYGIALAAAGLLVYPDTSIWLHAAG